MSFNTSSKQYSPEEILEEYKSLNPDNQTIRLEGASMELGREKSILKDVEMGGLYSKLLTNDLIIKLKNRIYNNVLLLNIIKK